VKLLWKLLIFGKVCNNLIVNDLQGFELQIIYIKRRSCMMSITYVYSMTADEFNHVRAAVGFRQIHPEQAVAEINGSTLVITAHDNERTVGMALLLWNGGGGALVSMLVIPKYQKQGIEEEMIKHFFVFLREKLKPGFGIQVDVRAFGSQSEVYEQLGFNISTTEQRGTPMHICLTNEIELTDKMFKQMEFKEK
jgi:GNAT superfamily N-acetyltransferase